MPENCFGKPKNQNKKTGQGGNPDRNPTVYLDRRLESTEPAICLDALLDFLLLSTFEALEAILEDVLTEFLAMSFHLLSKRTAEAGGRGGRMGCKGGGNPYTTILP